MLYCSPHDIGHNRKYQYLLVKWAAIFLYVRGSHKLCSYSVKCINSFNGDMIPDIFGVTTSPMTRVCYLTDRRVLPSSCVCWVTCSSCDPLNSSFAFSSLGFRNVRTRWVPLSGCVLLIPMLSSTSTRTSLLVSQQHSCRIWFLLFSFFFVNWMQQIWAPDFLVLSFKPVKHTDAFFYTR